MGYKLRVAGTGFENRKLTTGIVPDRHNQLFSPKLRLTSDVQWQNLMALTI